LRFIQHISGEVIRFRHPLACMFKAFGNTHFIRAVLHILNLSVGLFGKFAKGFSGALMLTGNCFNQLFDLIVCLTHHSLRLFVQGLLVSLLIR
jgi:hypothetical protein